MPERVVEAAYRFLDEHGLRSSPFAAHRPSDFARDLPLPPRGWLTPQAHQSLALVGERPSGSNPAHGDYAATLLQHYSYANPHVLRLPVTPVLNLQEHDSQRQLFALRGVSVISNSTGAPSNPPADVFSAAGQADRRYWRNVSAMVFNSAGNQREIRRQLPDYNRHFPRYAACVGAVEMEGGAPVVAAYSQQNCPDFVFPVLPHVRYNYNRNNDAQGITYESNMRGTSFAAPAVAGVAFALNTENGHYNTRHHRMLALRLSAFPVQARRLENGALAPLAPPIRNAAGYVFDPTYSGFGAVDAEAARRLDVWMAQRAQDIDDPELLMQQLVAAQVRPDATPPRRRDGMYVYEFTVPQAHRSNRPTVVLNAGDGQAEAQTAYLVSPSGTRVPLQVEEGRQQLFSTPAFTGEPGQGSWRIESPVPLRRIGFFDHGFHIDDPILRELTPQRVREIIRSPLPSPEELRHLRTFGQRGMQISDAGYRMDEATLAAAARQMPQLEASVQHPAAPEASAGHGLPLALKGELQRG